MTLQAEHRDPTGSHDWRGAWLRTPCRIRREQAVLCQPMSACRARASEDGFTLLEILVVLAVLGLAFGLVVSRGPVRSSRLDLRAIAGEMSLALRGAREESMATGRRTEFVLDLAQRRFRVGDEPVRTLPPTLEVSMTAALGEAVGRQVGAIGFLPDGTSTGGRIVLGVGGLRTVLSVDWLTGRVGVADGS